MTKILILLAAASWMPAHRPHHVEVWDHGHRLVRVYDPAPDTCKRQWAFVRSRRDQRIVAELVLCWGYELDNFSHHRLTVKYR